jgi:sugar (pentulose or hexulose) kinase
MVAQFDALEKVQKYPWKLEEILPKALLAGDAAGTLTAEGAKMLDVSGNLEAGIPLAPPEGDAGTGMTATNSVAVRTGNVSAGTSVFAMVVLEEELKAVHEELDLVTTPVGDAVAMVHCNNCTSDLNAWIGLFKESTSTTFTESSTATPLTMARRTAADFSRSTPYPESRSSAPTRDARCSRASRTQK